MAANNTLMVVGRAGSNPEVRTMGAHQVAKFNVAVNRPQKGKDGQYPTDWFSVELWGKQAELAERLVKKGDLVSVSGACNIDTWQDKQGLQRTSVLIKADGFQCLSPKQADGGRPASTHDDEKPFW